MTGGISRAGNFHILDHSQSRASSDDVFSTTRVMNNVTSDFKAQLASMFQLLPCTQFVNLQDLVMSPNINILEPIEHLITFNPNMNLVCSSIPVEHKITCILSGTGNYSTKFDTYTFHFLIYVANAQKAARMFGTIVININPSNQIAFMVILCYQEHVFVCNMMLDVYSIIPEKEAEAISFATLIIVHHRDMVYQREVVHDNTGDHHWDNKDGGSRNRINFRFNIVKLLPLLLSLLTLLHVVSSAQSSILQHDGKHTGKDLLYFNDTVWTLYHCSMSSSIFQSGELVNFAPDTFYDSGNICMNLQFCVRQKSAAVPKWNDDSHVKEDSSSEDQYVYMLCRTPLCTCDTEFLQVFIHTTLCDSAGK